jgi:transcriptional regulator
MNRIRDLRKKKKLSQKELADAVKIHWITLQNWESGKSAISAEKAQLLASFFGVNIGYLLGYENKREKVVMMKDFILTIENLKIDILTNSDNLNSYELSNVKKHARDLYESLVWLQYEAEERE